MISSCARHGHTDTELEPRHENRLLNQWVAQETSDHEHITLTALRLTTARQLAKLAENCSTDLSEPAFELPREAAEEFVALADYFHNYRDCADGYPETQKFEICDELQAYIGAGAHRRIRPRPRMPRHPDRAVSHLPRAGPAQGDAAAYGDPPGFDWRTKPTRARGSIWHWSSPTASLHSASRSRLPTTATSSGHCTAGDATTSLRSRSENWNCFHWHHSSERSNCSSGRTTISSLLVPRQSLRAITSPRTSLEHEQQRNRPNAIPGSSRRGRGLPEGVVARGGQAAPCLPSVWMG